jgi:hypothetical protein
MPKSITFQYLMIRANFFRKMLSCQLLALCINLLVTTGSAQSVAYSKPAGFVTHTLKPQQLNLIGLTLHEPVIYAGAFDSVDGNTLGDSNAQYDATLTSGDSYVLEIVDNPGDSSLNGCIQIVSEWQGTELTTAANLAVDNLNVGATYKLRAPKTISDVFGASNSAGLSAGANMSSADVIWLHNGLGFDKFYYSEGGGFGGGEAGWKNEKGEDAGDYPIIYTDAVIIQSKATLEKKLVISGVIKTKGVILALMAGKFNFISATYPVGSVLSNSGLEADLISNADIDTSDVVWMPDGEGDYNRYYYSPEGWKDSTGQGAAETPLTSGIIIERVGIDANAKLTPPETYNDL